MKKSIQILLFMVVGSLYSQKKISSDWTSFSQSVSIKTDKPKKFKVEASVKVIVQDSSAWAGVWARVDTNDDERGFFDNMSDRAIRLNEWKKYEVEGTINKNAETINFGGLCMYNGAFYFDDFKLYIENDKGDYELIPIHNQGFEEKNTEGFVSKWNLGIKNGDRVQVKEFDIRQVKDHAEGKWGLLVEGKGIKKRPDTKIGNVKGASSQIGAMISMLEDLKFRVERTVKNMDQYEIDYLHDEKANRIGALVMHLAAAEVYYQVLTFENRGFNEEEKKKWQVALELDQGGRDEFQGHDIQYYLDIYSEVREKTISELKKRDDKWFEEINNGYGYSNHYCWFHVMEHQSSHLGQILFLKKRIPPQPELKLEEKK